VVGAEYKQCFKIHILIVYSKVTRNMFGLENLIDSITTVWERAKWYVYSRVFRQNDYFYYNDMFIEY
jgi:hypothetical protein